MRTVFLALGMTFQLAVSQAGAAQPVSDIGRFDVYFAGLKAGDVQYGMTIEGGQYAATGRVKSSGLIAAIADFRFRADVRGRVTGDSFQPLLYTESSDTGRRKSDKEIAWTGGIPALVKSEDPDDHWADPARQGDALDPLTAFWQVLRDRPGDALCTDNITYFDGERRLRLLTAKPKRAGGEVTCRGTYIREGGFSDKAMREGREFPFDIAYRPDGELWEVSRIEVRTLRGRAVLIRR